MTDPTNAARQARHRKARALGYVSIPAGYLPHRRALKVFKWLDEAAEQIAPEAGTSGENISAKSEVSAGQNSQ